MPALAHHDIDVIVSVNISPSRGGGARVHLRTSATGTDNGTAADMVAEVARLVDVVKADVVRLSEAAAENQRTNGGA